MSPGEICLYGPLSSSSGWVLCVRIILTFPGIIILKICFPVHNGWGLRMAGCISLPSQSGIHIMRFIMASWEKKKRFLNFRNETVYKCELKLSKLGAKLHISDESLATQTFPKLKVFFFCLFLNNLPSLIWPSDIWSFFFLPSKIRVIGKEWKNY